MILGDITIYQCDGIACDTTKIVPVEEQLKFEQLWHAGLSSHFCPRCKVKFENAAAIAADEKAMRKVAGAEVKNAA